MLTLFNAIVFVHVVSAILWIGSAVVLELLEFESTHSSKRERIASSLNRSSWFAKHVFGPAAMVTILSGILAVAVGRPSFGQLWVIFALVGVVLVTALGAGVIGRTSSKLAARLQDPLVDEDEIEAGLMNIRWAVYLDLALLFFILFDMVVRPTKFDPGFFIVSGLFFAAVAAGTVHRVHLRR